MTKTHLNPYAPANTFADLVYQNYTADGNHAIVEVKTGKNRMPSLSDLSFDQALTLGINQFGIDIKAFAKISGKTEKLIDPSYIHWY